MKNVIPTLKYLVLTLKHRWFVFVAGIGLRVPLWRLLTHDLSKFLPSELPHYGRQFFGSKDDGEGFIRTWTRHQNRNDHHFEYWIPRTGHNRCTPPYRDNEPIPMPEDAVLEMVADWMGASRAYEGVWPRPGRWPWLAAHFREIRVHEDTRALLVNILRSQGFEV